MAPLAAEDDGGGTRVVESLAWSLGAPIDAEPSGRAYWDYLQRVRAVDAKKLSNVSALAIVDDGNDEDDDGPADFTLRTDLTPTLVTTITYYEILGFDTYGTGVKDEALKKAYRRAVLTYHPDKTGSSRGEEDEVFMAVQKAFETLSDPLKRKQYDSSLDFDDAIPDEGTGSDSPAAFFAAYAPVFERNERFAVLLPAPKMGDDDTPIEEVHKFYEYWINFESWRDFTIDACEHDLEDAEDRYHKRWMQKENDKKNRELKRKEYRRLTTLVDRARATDPRIKRAREQEKEAKRQAKESKLAAAAAIAAAEAEAAAAAAAAAAEAEERRKEEARAVKAEKEKKKKELRRLRKLLRPLLAPVAKGGMAGPEISELVYDDKDFLIEETEAGVLEAAIELLGGAEGPWDPAGVAKVISLIQRVRQRADGAVADEAAAREAELERLRAAERKAEEDRKLKLRPWSEDELSCLAKAVVRFPAGAQNRWEHVSAFLSQQLRLSDPRSKEECIAKYQELHAAPAQAKDKIMRRPQNSAEEPVPMPEAPTPVAAAAAAAAAVAKSATPTAAAAKPAAAPRRAEGKAVPQPAAAPAAAPVAPAAAPASQNGDAAADAAEAWSQVQQKQLEEALAKFPASMEKNERWKNIAAAVSGKNKKQCVERFKHIKTLLQQQQAKA